MVDALGKIGPTRCPRCHADCPTESAFCPHCGTPLLQSCPACGFRAPSDFAFCPRCGARLAPTPPQVSPDTPLADALDRLVPKQYADWLRATGGHAPSERRLVTILFSDIKGSTALASGRDPEEVGEIIHGAFELLISPIHRHEGLLADLMGDAILAFFGAPIAHEDDPERAIRAGLDIVAGAQAYARKLETEWGITGFNVRVGINTGLVVTGEVGADRRMTYTATGDAINMAARMEQNAPPGGILITQDTYRLVRGLFDVQPQAPLLVKGKEGPLQTYLVTAARARGFYIGTRGVAGIETRMVGRERQQKTLKEAFRSAAEQREPRLVTIAGEPGVGKSRLLHEFMLWLDLVPQRASVFRARAYQESQSLAGALLRDLFTSRFQILDSDPAAEARAKIEQGIGQTLGQDPEAEVKAHILGQWLGFDFSASRHVAPILTDARQIRDRGLLYLIDFFRATCREQPAVVLIEDLHWADDSSLDAMLSLAAAASGQRLLIVCTARPTLFERRPHWGDILESHVRMELGPLSQRDSRCLMSDILQKAKPLPAELRDLLVNGAEGNPFFLEELITMLIEDGVIVPGVGRWRVDLGRLSGLRVPHTLTGVLQARLDSLPLQERSVLQLGAVVGRTFWDSAVERIAAAEQVGHANVDTTLTSLRSREMVFRHASSAFAGCAEYAFKHALLRDVTYESVLKSVRRHHHALVARWLIEQGGDRVAEYAGLIAGHLEAAGKAEEAIVYLEQASREAASRYATVEAIGYLNRALTLTPEGNRQQRYAQLLARQQLEMLHGLYDKQREDLNKMSALADALDDDHRRGEVALWQAMLAEKLQRHRDQLAAAEAAIGFGQAVQDQALAAGGYLQVGRAHWHLGEFDMARGSVMQALDLARSARAPQVEADAVRTLGVLDEIAGDEAGATARYEEARALCRASGDHEGEASCLNNLAGLCEKNGDLVRALSHYQQALDIWRRIGARGTERVVLFNMAIALWRLGDVAGARALAEQALSLCREVAKRPYADTALLCLGRILHEQGQSAAALGRIREAVQIARESGDPYAEGPALLTLGLVLSDLGQVREAGAVYVNALHISKQLARHDLLGDPLAGLARLALARGDTAEALARVEQILPDLRGPLSARWMEPFRAWLTCYQVLRAAGDARAADVLRQAHARLQEMAAKIPDEARRRSFLEGHAERREIMAAFARQQHDQP